MVNRRALRNIEADGSVFKERAENARTLRAAMDDGFNDYTVDGVDRRPDLVGCEMVIIGWQLRSRGSGREVARVWALARTAGTDDVEKVKFYDAGQGNIIHPGIAVTLRELEDNGVTGNIRVCFRAEQYSFTSDDGGTVEAVRYWIEDVDPKDNRERLAQEEDEPDF